MVTYDSIVVGGGFYGLRIAQYLREELKQKKVLVIDKDKKVMQRASYNNQARVHNGYHYPRSVLTALRSRVNSPIFSREYSGAIVDDFEKHYAVATSFSKVSAQQFERFFQRIGSEITAAPEMMSLFNPKLIEKVFKVKEAAFNSDKIRAQLMGRLADLKVKIHTQESVRTVKKYSQNDLVLNTNKDTYQTKYVINATYSSINSINRDSNLPIIPLKHELTEMCLVRIPPEFKNRAFTIMCGPFFSLMPFPPRENLYTLSHVRYTPHKEWHDHQELLTPKITERPASHFPQMYADIKRYMPFASKIEYTGESLWEVKTVLPQSENDDSRPIMYLKDHGGLKNYICIMGGKIDNIYDVFRELKNTYEAVS